MPRITHTDTHTFIFKRCTHSIFKAFNTHWLAQQFEAWNGMNKLANAWITPLSCWSLFCFFCRCLCVVISGLFTERETTNKGKLKSSWLTNCLILQHSAQQRVHKGPFKTPQDVYENAVMASDNSLHSVHDHCQSLLRWRNSTVPKWLLLSRCGCLPAQGNLLCFPFAQVLN